MACPRIARVRRANSCHGMYTVKQERVQAKQNVVQPLTCELKLAWLPQDLAGCQSIRLCRIWQHLVFPHSCARPRQGQPPRRCRAYCMLLWRTVYEERPKQLLMRAVAISAL